MSILRALGLKVNTNSSEAFTVENCESDFLNDGMEFPCTDGEIDIDLLLDIV